MIRKIIAPAVALVLVYLLASFILWEWNPGQWGAGIRYLAACLGIGFSGLVFAAQEGLV